MKLVVALLCLTVTVDCMAASVTYRQADGIQTTLDCQDAYNSTNSSIICTDPNGIVGAEIEIPYPIIIGITFNKPVVPPWSIGKEPAIG